jgi:hypothetical protein
MLPQVSKFGIYLNPKESKVVRITSPYWIPEAPDWVYVTGEVNSPLLKIKQLIGEQRLSDDAESVTWGRIPVKSE